MMRGCDMPLEQGLELENELVSQVLRTEDFTEGITAYLEKRKAEYKGR